MSAPETFEQSYRRANSGHYPHERPAARELTAVELLALILDELDELMAPRNVAGVVVDVNSEQWRKGVAWAHRTVVFVGAEAGLIPPPGHAA
jgi:hypothetical protein